MSARRSAASTPNLPELSASIGSRIRGLRTRRGISLASLAIDTRLGKGTLSELERGRRNPTLDTLFAIATALSVPLGDLLTAPSNGPDINRDSRPRAHGQSVDAELIGRWTEPGETVEVYRMTISFGQRQSHSHAAGVTETVTVISGEVLVGCNSAPARLASGQSHSFPGDRDHFYEGLLERSSTVLIMRYPLSSSDMDGCD
jgi:XRE family transcriptional regulator, regulator of sulfur utilization